MASAVLGIASGMALSVAMIGILAGFDKMIDLSFDVIDRSDVTVSFNEAISNKAIFKLQSLPGVIEVEPARVVPVVLRHGLKSHRGAINGLVASKAPASGRGPQHGHDSSGCGRNHFV
ncbi:MAG: hypothetical protein EYX74_07465 [Desulfobulbaceae bacterium]|nr:MAG: hypothetical protein EYX74_07465 [Desulfobulbaceae bacterium]